MSKQKPKLNQNTIHRVLKLIRPYTGMVILTLTFALITVVTTLLAPVLSGKAVDMILGPGEVDFVGLGKIALVMAGTIACTALSQWLMNVVNNRITFQVVRDIRVKAFERTHGLFALVYKTFVSIHTDVHKRVVNMFDVYPPLFKPQPEQCVFVTVFNAFLVKHYLHEHIAAN